MLSLSRNFLPLSLVFFGLRLFSFRVYLEFHHSFGSYFTKVDIDYFTLPEVHRLQLGDDSILNLIEVNVLFSHRTLLTPSEHQVPQRHLISFSEDPLKISIYGVPLYLLGGVFSFKF